MFVFQNLFLTIIKLLYRVCDIYVIILIARAIFSWFFAYPNNKIYLFLIQITEPVLYRIRRFLPVMSIDFSPLIAILIIDFIIKRFILGTLAQIIIQL